MATVANKKTKSKVKTIFKKIVSSSGPVKKVLKKKVLSDIKTNKIKKVLIKRNTIKTSIPKNKKIIKNKLVLKKKKFVSNKKKLEKKEEGQRLMMKSYLR